MRISSYPKVWALGHALIADLLKDPVVIEEKVDGSQISFGWLDGELHIRSKGAVVHTDTRDKLFGPSIRQIDAVRHRLPGGWIFRGEAVCGVKHNTATYGRVPKGNVVLFDIETGPSTFIEDPDLKRYWAEELGMECVHRIDYRLVENAQDVHNLLERESFLGGCKIEGVVLKNYHRFGPDGKFLVGKYVSEDFKEKNSKNWKGTNPSQGDIIHRLGTAFAVPGRWAKAVQHLREAGQIEDSPRDIGKLIGEVQRDVLEEEGEWIKDQLFRWGWEKMRRLTHAGLPEWYKSLLLERQFGVTPADVRCDTVDTVSSGACDAGSSAPAMIPYER